ncbi:hypothetical protein CLOM_g24211 [Closterium sp. NIES-68]|nr:hypothetical protein CLOM_g24211 [Closterium sp. NIES-68]GJP60011.1 hypothetical protein CLOP_g17158 [Closterium sp. NIES-67]
MYRLQKEGAFILLIVYVDDLLYIGSTTDIATWFEGELKEDLTLTVSDAVTQYLGLNVVEENSAFYLHAGKYAGTVAEKFGLTPTTVPTPYRYGNNNSTSAKLPAKQIQEYQQKLGCLLFAAVTCRPDLSYSASQLATHLKQPEQEDLEELNRARGRQGKSTIENGLHLPTRTYRDYLLADGFANRTKHIALRYFFVNDEIAKGRLQLSYCPTTEMAVDYLTKKLAKEKIEYCTLLTGQTNVTGSEHVSTPETKGSVGNISKDLSVSEV